MTEVADDDEPRRRRRAIGRDAIMFVLGAGLLINEAIMGSDRANLIYAGFACLAAGAFGRAYARLNGRP